MSPSARGCNTHHRMSNDEATEAIEAAFDRELSDIASEHRCVDGRVSIDALCELLGHTGQQATKKLSFEYREFARNNNVTMPVKTKKFIDKKSSKAKMQWVLVKDAFDFLLHRGTKNKNKVIFFLNDILQQTTATKYDCRVKDAVVAAVEANEEVDRIKEHANVQIKAAEERCRIVEERVAEEAQKSENHKRKFDRLLEVTTKAQNFDEVFAEPESGKKPNDDGVYVLELGEGGKFYVGQSRNISRRIEDHQSGRQRAAYVDANGGILRQLAPSTPRNEDFAEWEKKETLYLMMKYGYENVRGWEWTRVGPLCFNDLHMIKRDMMGTLNLCRKCGTKGHFAAQCNIRPENRNGWLKELDKLISKANFRGAGRLSFEQLMEDLI